MHMSESVQFTIQFLAESQKAGLCISGRGDFALPYVEIKGCAGHFSHCVVVIVKHVDSLVA